MIRGIIMYELSLLAIGILIGFGGGYGVREFMSRRRRAQEKARLIERARIASTSGDRNSWRPLPTQPSPSG